MEVPAVELIMQRSGEDDPDHIRGEKSVDEEAIAQILYPFSQYFTAIILIAQGLKKKCDENRRTVLLSRFLTFPSRCFRNSK